MGTSVHFVIPDYLFNERRLWAIVFWISYAAIFIVSSLAQRRERTGERGDKRDRGSRPIIYVVSAIGIIGAFGAPSFAPWARIGLPPEPVFWTAIALIWIGVLLYNWALTTLGAFFRTSVQLLEGQRLVTRGPYRVLRHPAYAAGITIFAGIGLGTGNWISAMIAPLAVAVGYAWRIHVEEIALRERFGADFDKHKQRTWAVIPFVW
jgi:protein-S-isoprenylcysteine O-methyltransferase Ste14